MTDIIKRSHLYDKKKLKITCFLVNKKDELNLHDSRGQDKSLNQVNFALTAKVELIILRDIKSTPKN